MRNPYPAKYIIPNPPCFERGEWSDIDALCANLDYLGESVDADTVESAAAASALFDFHYSERWFDDAATTACSGDVLGEACAALGHECSWVAGESFEKTWNSLRERIAYGQPVIAGGIIPAEELETCYCSQYSLVVGYDESGDAPRVAVVGRKPRSAVTWTELPSVRGKPNYWHARVRSLVVAPNVWAVRPLLYLNGKVSEPTVGTLELARENLGRCVEYATSNGGPVGEWRLWPGLRGMQVWAQDLGDYEAAIDRESPDSRGFPLTNISLGLACAFEQRRAAFARYLRDIRHLFQRDAKSRLSEAVEHCEKQVALMASFRELLFGLSGTWAEQQELGTRNLHDASVRTNAASVLEQVADEEQTLVGALACAASPE